MARKEKMTRDAAEIRDRKRDRDGWKAKRQTARRNKAKRREIEIGEKF